METNNLFLRHLDFFHHDRNCELKIYQKYVGDVGCVVWDAALVLLNYLFTGSGQKFIYKKQALELGSGTGAVGLASILAGASGIVITDLPEHLPLMKLNIKENIDTIKKFFSDSTVSKHVQSHILRWGSKKDLQAIYQNFSNEASHSQIECVLIADCIYYRDGMLKLYETIVMIMNDAHSSCNVLCCYEVRDTPEKVELVNSFCTLIKSNPSLKMSSIPLSEMDEQFRSEDIHIIVISKSCS